MSLAMTLPDGTVLTRIARQSIVNRSGTLWPFRGVPYSMSLLWEGKYRQDCSGYASLAANLPTNAPGSWGGYSTVSMVTRGVVFEINQSMILPGDLIMRGGPGTQGANGHVYVLIGREGNGFRIREQRGGIKGWDERTIPWPSGYKSYRFVNVIEADGTTYEPGAIPVVPSQRLPEHALGSRLLSTGSFGTDVAEVQYLHNCHDPNANLVIDGDYGPATTGITIRFQKFYQLEVDGVVGPQTIDHLVSRLKDRSFDNLLPGGHYFGHVDGPNESHGGWDGTPATRAERAAIRVIQLRAKEITGMAIQVDGVFGGQTDSVVREMQRKIGATVDGKVGSQTWAKMWAWRPPVLDETPPPPDPEPDPAPPPPIPDPAPTPDTPSGDGEQPPAGESGQGPDHEWRRIFDMLREAVTEYRNAMAEGERRFNEILDRIGQELEGPANEPTE